MDLTRPGLLYFKATLFVIGAMMAATIVLLECPRWRVFAMLWVIAWCAARAYYFCFYVIHRYVDPRTRYVGLWAMLTHLARRRIGRARDDVGVRRPV